MASALNSVLTAGRLWKLTFDSVSSTARRSRGLGISTLLPPMRMPSIMFAVKPKM